MMTWEYAHKPEIMEICRDGDATEVGNSAKRKTIPAILEVIGE